MNVMNVTPVNFQGNWKKTEKSGNSGLGSALGCAGGMAVQTAVSGVAGVGVLSSMNKIGKITPDKVDILHKAAEKALNISGMSAKGVKIEYLKAPATKKGIFSILRLPPIEQIKNGFNAAFIPGNAAFVGNKILMPEKDMAFAAFHEIGHSINYNSSKFWKALQKMRMPGMALATLPLLYGAFSKKSVAKDGKELTKAQKANNFIRDNAGKLSFAAMVPMLAEEAMASIRGQKLANKLLDGKMAKHVLKGNAVAYLSYLGTAIALGLGSYAAVKIKDHFQAKKDAKEQEAKMLQESLERNKDVIV